MNLIRRFLNLLIPTEQKYFFTICNQILSPACHSQNNFPKGIENHNDASRREFIVSWALDYMA